MKTGLVVVGLGIDRGNRCGIKEVTLESLSHFTVKYIDSGGSYTIRDKIT